MDNSQKGMLEAWERVLAAMEANQADFALAEDCRRELAASAEALRALQVQRAILRNQMLLKTQEAQALLASGNELLIRIRSFAKSRYGIHSAKLTEFGIKPQQRRKRK